MKKKPEGIRIKPLQVAVWSVYGRATVGLVAPWRIIFDAWAA